MLWILSNQNEKLTNLQKAILENPNIEKYVSQISLMEIAIKQKLGKLGTFDNVSIEAIVEEINANELLVLNIQNQHVSAYSNVPLQEQHRDPFDRFLIATALSENMSMMTSDEKFRLYEDIISLI